MIITASNRTRMLLCLGLMAALLLGCTADDEASSARISSPATISIVEPAQGQTVTGDTMRVVIDLQEARIIPEATRRVRPDEGHIHLSLDGELSEMSYGLDQEIPVTPGNHILQAEFVAGNHVPFNPRIIAVRRINVQ